MRKKLKTIAASISVFSNIFLVIAKLIVGIMSGSVAIISEAIHSGIDLLAACIAWLAVLLSSEPADRNHPYGHGKFENISGTIEAILIFLAAGWIIYEAINKLLVPTQIQKLDLGILVMGVASVVNLIVSNVLFKVGKQTDSVALIADGWHLRTDVYTSAGVMGSLILIYVGKKFFPTLNLNWIDPVAGIAVAMLIIKASYSLIKQVSYDLVDGSLPENEVTWICNYINNLSPTVISFHNLRTRKAGSYRFIEMHIIVDGDLTVTEAYEITKKIIKELTEYFVDPYVIIQVEPYQPKVISNFECK